MEKFTNIINEGNQEVVIQGMKTNKYGNTDSIAYLNTIIKSYIEKVYGPFGFVYPSRQHPNNYDITVDGELINTEYISKMVNNYTVFKRIIIDNSIKTSVEFYEYMIANLEDIYHYGGEFFKANTLPILINTTRKGNAGETSSKKKFTEYAVSKGLDIKVENPTIVEDIKGIDAKFYFKSRFYHIQIKPFNGYIKIGNKHYFKSEGSLSTGNIDYMILYSDKGDFVLLKNTPADPIGIAGNKFVVNTYSKL